jgi:hypothetical protein
MIYSQSQREPKNNDHCRNDRFLASADVENVLRPWQGPFQLSVIIRYYCAPPTFLNQAE